MSLREEIVMIATSAPREEITKHLDALIRMKEAERYAANVYRSYEGPAPSRQARTTANKMLRRAEGLREMANSFREGFERSGSDAAYDASLRALLAASWLAEHAVITLLGGARH